MAKTVELKKIVEKMNLKNLTPDVELNDKKVEVPDINRPALQLTGFFEHFDSERVQIIGYVEYTFLEKMDEEKKREVYKTLLSYKIPCIIFCYRILFIVNSTIPLPFILSTMWGLILFFIIFSI